MLVDGSSHDIPLTMAYRIFQKQTFPPPELMIRGNYEDEDSAAFTISRHIYPSLIACLAIPKSSVIRFCGHITYMCL